MAAYRWVDGFRVTCGLTVCTRGSAPGPTLGNEYMEKLYLLLVQYIIGENGDDGVYCILCRLFVG